MKVPWSLLNLSGHIREYVTRFKSQSLFCSNGKYQGTRMSVSWCSPSFCPQSHSYPSPPSAFYPVDWFCRLCFPGPHGSWILAKAGPWEALRLIGVHMEGRAEGRSRCSPRGFACGSCSSFLAHVSLGCFQCFSSFFQNAWPRAILRPSAPPSHGVSGVSRLPHWPLFGSS